MLRRLTRGAARQQGTKGRLNRVVAVWRRPGSGQEGRLACVDTDLAAWRQALHRERPGERDRADPRLDRDIQATIEDEAIRQEMDRPDASRRAHRVRPAERDEVARPGIEQERV